MLNFSEIARGLTDTMILARLSGGDSYGYRISKEIRDLSGGRFEFKEATLYTAFRRMEQEGLIRSYWGDEVTGNRRRYYHITQAGLALYGQNMADWKVYQAWISSMLGMEEQSS